MADAELGAVVKLEKKDKNKKSITSPRDKKEKKEKEKKEKEKEKEKERKPKEEKAQAVPEEDNRASDRKSKNLARVLSFSSAQKKEKDAEKAAGDKTLSRSKSERRVASSAYPKIEIGTTRGPNGVQTFVQGGVGTSTCAQDLVARDFVRHGAEELRKDGDVLLETVSFLAENGWTMTQALSSGTRIMSYNVPLPQRRVEPLELNTPLPSKPGLLARLTSPRKEESARRLSPQRLSPRGGEIKKEKEREEIDDKKEKEREAELEREREKEKEKREREEKEKKERKDKDKDKDKVAEEVASPRSLRARMTRFFTRNQVQDDLRKEKQDETTAQALAAATTPAEIAAAMPLSLGTDASDEARIVAYLYERGLENSRRIAAGQALAPSTSSQQVKFQVEGAAPGSAASANDTAKTELSGPSPPSSVAVSPSADREARANGPSSAAPESTGPLAVPSGEKRPSQRISAKMLPLLDLPEVLAPAQRGVDKASVAPTPEQLFRPETARSLRPKQQDEPEQPSALFGDDGEPRSPGSPDFQPLPPRISPRNSPASPLPGYSEMPKPRAVVPRPSSPDYQEMPPPKGAAPPPAAIPIEQAQAQIEEPPEMPVRSPRALQYGKSARISPRISPRVSPRATSDAPAPYIPPSSTPPRSAAMSASFAQPTFALEPSRTSARTFELKLEEERRREEEALIALKRKKEEEKRRHELEKERRREERKTQQQLALRQQLLQEQEEAARSAAEEEQARKMKEEQERAAKAAEEPPAVPPRSPRAQAYAQQAIVARSPPSSPRTEDLKQLPPPVPGEHPGVAVPYEPQSEQAPRIADDVTAAAAPLISLSYKALKDKCTEKGLETTGGKEDLIRRLVKAESSASLATSSTKASAPKPAAAAAAAAPTATSSGAGRYAEERRRQQQLEEEQRKAAEEERRKKREELERRIKEEQERVEAERRKREEERRKKREEEERKRAEEEAERRRRREEEEKRLNEERKKREEERRKRMEEERKRREDEAAQIEAERKRREEERLRQREERERQLKEEEDARRRKREEDEKRRAAAK